MPLSQKEKTYCSVFTLPSKAAESYINQLEK
jgi:hypothetical protein